MLRILKQVKDLIMFNWQYYTILKDIYSRVHPAVNAPTSPSPNKDNNVKKEELINDEHAATVNGKSEPLD